jgi:calcium-dependent protein kinase
VCRYMVGKVIGAGSFGVVRDAVQRGTGIRYAVKSVPKTPKRGVPTPRYLLKLRQEVDAMQQLGASLDAVYLAVRALPPDAAWYIDQRMIILCL